MHDTNIKNRFVLLLVALVISAPSTGRGTGGILVFNPGSPAGELSMKGWLMPFTMAYMREWGRSRGLAVADDRGPVVDNSAAYVGPRGSSIMLDGLARGGRYRMWLDFVRFRSSKHSPPAVLKIFASAPRVASRLLAAVRFADIGDSYYAVDLPLEITIGGRAEIRFVEFSREPGMWGVWDIIISDGRDCPPALDISGDNVMNSDSTERIVH